MINSEREEIERLLSDYEEAFNRNDISAAASYFSESIISMPPGHEVLVGMQAIIDYMVKMFEGKVAELNTFSREIEVGVGWAFGLGAYLMKTTLKGGGRTMEEKGKYLMVFRKDRDGSWKIDREAWNTDGGPQSVSPKQSVS